MRIFTSPCLNNTIQCPASSTVCFKCNKQGHYIKLCHSKVQVHQIPIEIQGDLGAVEVGVTGHGSKHAVFEAKTTDTSKPIVDATNSKVDVVKMLQAYCMVSSEGSELKHRRKSQLMRSASSRLLVMTLYLNTNHWYYVEVQWNATLMYSGNHLMKICQFTRTSPPILFQWRQPTLQIGLLMYI